MDEPTSYQPGQTIQPGGSNNDQPVNPPVSSPGESPPTPVGGSPRDPNDPAPQPINDPNQPKPEELEQPTQPPTSSPPSPPPAEPPVNDGADRTALVDATNLPPLLSWEASEYVEHQHGAMWYLGMIAATIVLAGACLLLFREWLSAVVVVLVMIALFIYARRAPRVLRYVLNEAGISIGNKFYAYQDFRSFSLRSEHSFFTIELEPLKRFMPRLSLFSDSDSGNNIASILERFLPRSDRQPDVIDRMSNRLKI